MYGDYIVIAEVGAETPEVFGPFVNLHEVDAAVDALENHPAVESVFVSRLLPGSDAGEYQRIRDELGLDEGFAGAPRRRPR